LVGLDTRRTAVFVAAVGAAAVGAASVGVTTGASGGAFVATVGACASEVGDAAMLGAGASTRVSCRCPNRLAARTMIATHPHKMAPTMTLMNRARAGEACERSGALGMSGSRSASSTSMVRGASSGALEFMTL
jgi:hypothetical protein